MFCSQVLLVPCCHMSFIHYWFYRFIMCDHCLMNCSLSFLMLTELLIDWLMLLFWKTKIIVVSSHLTNNAFFSVHAISLLCSGSATMQYVVLWLLLSPGSTVVLWVCCVLGTAMFWAHCYVVATALSHFCVVGRMCCGYCSVLLCFLVLWTRTEHGVFFGPAHINIGSARCIQSNV